MLIRGAKYENRVCRRFLKSFEEGVECRLREHMHLVDDVHAVTANLRRYLDLVHQSLDVIHSVVGCGIEFADAVGAALRERQAGLTLPARVHICSRIGTVDGFGENAGCGCLSHPTRSAEEVSVRKLTAKNRVLQRPCNHILSDKRFKRVGTIFSGRYDII